MKKKLSILLSIVSFTMLDGMKTNQKNVQSPKDPYNCENLMQEFDYLAGNKEKIDNTLNVLMDMKYEIPETHLKKQIAALICFGANSHWKHKYYMKNLLDYGIESDDTQFVSFLLKHNITIIDDPNYYIHGIRSLAMLQKLEPYIHINKKELELNNRWTIAHHIAEKRWFPADLLEYWVNNFDITNKVNGDNELPLHTLARNCSSSDYSFYQSSIRKKAKTLIERTTNINALDKKGRTPTDLALKSRNSNDDFGSCKILIDMLKKAGGKATSTNKF